MPSCCWPVRRLMPCINNFFFFLSSSIPSWQILFIDLTAKGEIAFQEILSHLVEQQTNKYLCQNIASSTCIFLAGRSTSSASLRCAYHVIAAGPPPPNLFFSPDLGARWNSSSAPALPCVRDSGFKVAWRHRVFVMSSGGLSISTDYFYGDFWRGYLGIFKWSGKSCRFGQRRNGASLRKNAGRELESCLAPRDVERKEKKKT